MAQTAPGQRGIRAITLDLDDTLWPVKPVLAKANQALIDWLQLRAPRAAAVLAAGYDPAVLKARHPEHAHDMSWLRRRMLLDVLQAQGEDTALAEPAFQIFYEMRQQVDPFEDAVPVLELWSQRYRLAVITNGNADVFRSPLAPFFQVALGAPGFGAAKPDPGIFHAACDALGVVPAETLHIGDDLGLDVEAARQAGLHAAWLRRPVLYNANLAEKATSPDCACRSFRSLWEINDELKRECFSM